MSSLIPFGLALVAALLGGCSDDAGRTLETPDHLIQDEGQPDQGVLDLGEDLGSITEGCVATGESCPGFRLSLDQECEEDTTGALNTVFDPRLEFGGDGEHLLAFTAPTDGTFQVKFEPPNGNDACGISVYDSMGEPHSPQTDCPSSPLQTTDLDGVYYSGQQVSLVGGQELLIAVGCPAWVNQREGRYSLTVRKL